MSFLAGVSLERNPHLAYASKRSAQANIHLTFNGLVYIVYTKGEIPCLS
jgi:hypothetical protein